ncbi:MAG: NAD(P)H-hydrate dehydratase [Dehalococcoidia bacterium]|nr:NAD(P)H-hydrate dehydratase [Dehalococcoidia bacterium]
MKIVTVAEMKRIETEAEKAGITAVTLMENAGRAAAETIRCRMGGADGRWILALIGPGNNGGDGEVAARCLADWGWQVTLYLCAPRPADDGNLEAAIGHGVKVITATEDANQELLMAELSAATAVIDAVLGTGRSRKTEGVIRQSLMKLSVAVSARPELKIFAMDLPSGLDADSGEADSATPFADYTLTLGLPKRGLYTPSGAERAGEVIILDIGLSEHLTLASTCELLTPDWARKMLPARLPYAHKGSFGKVMALAGSLNYPGAARLACGAAVRTGAGLVTLAVPKGIQSLIAPSLPEVTYLPLDEESAGIAHPEACCVVLESLDSYNVMLVGSGLGASAKTKDLTLNILSGLPDMLKLVLDADALNYLAGEHEWWKRLPCDAVITPHPGEMARLCGISIDEVQNNRFDLVLSSAREWNKTIVLKGAFTLIAAPDGRVRVSPFANAALASAGTGDVLAGAIAGLLAQGNNLFDGAALGVYLHALAGEVVRRRQGDAGLAATDLLPELPLAIKTLKENGQNP